MVMLLMVFIKYIIIFIYLEKRSVVIQQCDTELYDMDKTVIIFIFLIFYILVEKI